MQDVPLNFEGLGTDALPGENTADHSAEFGELISGFLNIIMVIALLILLFMLIWGAFEWLTSAGDNSKLQNARNRMMHAIVGILILSATLALFMFVQYLLGVEFININL